MEKSESNLGELKQNETSDSLLINKRRISIIAAMSQNRVIGCEGHIPWKIPGEQKRFRELTLHNTVIMGRKTFESIGKALPGRRTIAVSRDPGTSVKDAEVAHNIDEALGLCYPGEEIMVAGGGQIYRAFLPITDTLYLTVIEKEFEGDITFPETGPEFIEIGSKQIDANIPYTYKTFKRVR